MSVRPALRTVLKRLLTRRSSVLQPFTFVLDIKTQNALQACANGTDSAGSFPDNNSTTTTFSLWGVDAYGRKFVAEQRPFFCPLLRTQPDDAVDGWERCAARRGSASDHFGQQRAPSRGIHGSGGCSCSFQAQWDTPEIKCKSSVPPLEALRCAEEMAMILPCAECVLWYQEI